MNHNAGQQPCASVLIRVRNEANALQHVLEQIGNQKVNAPFEVVVLDNESEDDSARVAQAAGANVFTLPRTLFGYGRALNVGVKLCKANLIVLLSAHVRPQNEHWLQHMIDHAEADHTVAAIYCKQLPDDQSSSQEQARFAAFPENDYRLDKNALLMCCEAKEDVYEICSFSNSACIIRREAALHFPFRDLPYAEDRAFALDCVLAGHSIAYLSTELVQYEQSATLKALYRFARSAQISKQLIRELATNAIGMDLRRAELGIIMARLAVKPIAIVTRAVEASVRDRSKFFRSVRFALISTGTAWGLLMGELVWRKYREMLRCDKSALLIAEQSVRRLGKISSGQSI